MIQHFGFKLGFAVSQKDVEKVLGEPGDAALYSDFHKMKPRLEIAADVA